MPIGCPDVRVQQVAAWTRGMAAPIPVESATRQNTRRKGGVFFIVMSFIVMALYGGIPLDVNAPENPFTDARCSLGRQGWGPRAKRGARAFEAGLQSPSPRLT